MPKLTARSYLDRYKASVLCSGYSSITPPLTLKGLMRRTTNTEGLKLGTQDIQYIICQTSYSGVKTSPLHCSNHPTKFTGHHTVPTCPPLSTTSLYDI